LRALARGQTNYLAMLWKFSSVYNAERQHGDHARPVRYALRPRHLVTGNPTPAQLYIHQPAAVSRRAAG
ncbi:MAG TPA: hopanoid C-3 methylase HpnR, partial [Methylomirabilota bacterium]|nr:hopanoid C-3 methylase HpnR [Methylomirabilota bacterium]